MATALVLTIMIKLKILSVDTMAIEFGPVIGVNVIKPKSSRHYDKGSFFFRPENTSYYGREDADGARSEHKKDKL